MYSLDQRIEDHVTGDDIPDHLHLIVIGTGGVVDRHGDTGHPGDGPHHLDEGM